MAAANCYRGVMSVEKIRRISAVLMVLVLTIGVATHGLAGPEMIAKPSMAVANDMPMSSDLPMPGKCSGCAGHEKGIAPSAACLAFCGVATAMPSAAVVLHAVPVDTLRPSTELAARGRADPPDPYPPRPTILS